MRYEPARESIRHRDHLSWRRAEGAGAAALAALMRERDRFAGKKADQNQWGGVTLEWKTHSPPPHLNFDEQPVVTGEVYDYSTLTAEEMKR